MAAALAAVLVVVSGVLVVVAANLVSPGSTGADTAAALHQVAIVPPNASELTGWLPDDWQRQRTIEPDTRTLVAAAYIRSWAAIGRYESDGDTNEIFDTFSGAARTSALGIARTGDSATWDLHHSLRLEFYALDGATVAFTDVGASVVRTVGSGDGETVLLSRDTYSVVMVLEDGYWRVRQLQRATVGDPLVVSTALTGLTAIDGSTGNHPSVNAPGTVLATDYRPLTWSTRASAQLKKDFARAKALGLTTLRVPLPFEVFGRSTPSSSAIRGLKTLLAIAAGDELTIDPVLMDGLTDLSPATWVGADAQAAAIVSATSGSSALGIWDLADRPDLRTSNASRTEVRAFLIQLASIVRQSGSPKPITISFSAASEATDPVMLGIVDVLSVDLSGPDAVSGSIDTLQRNALRRPSLVTVTDLGTEGGWFPVPHTESRQQSAVAGILLAAQRAGLTRVGVASLRDSAASPYVGILRADGSAKPAAALFAHPASLGTVGQPGPLDYVGSKFWITALAVVALVLVLGIFSRVRRRRS